MPTNRDQLAQYGAHQKDAAAVARQAQLNGVRPSLHGGGSDTAGARLSAEVDHLDAELRKRSGELTR